MIEGIEVKRIDQKNLRTPETPQKKKRLRRRRNAPEVMTREEAAFFLRIGVDLLSELVESEQIPCRKIGRRLLFGKGALVRWVEKTTS